VGTGMGSTRWFAGNPPPPPSEPRWVLSRPTVKDSCPEGGTRRHGSVHGTVVGVRDPELPRRSGVHDGNVVGALNTILRRRVPAGTSRAWLSSAGPLDLVR